ncbi:MAG: beta-ketoacyl-ACP synthase 3, partial [Wenzhouxiangellaceae bacterium]|nr:beta-ketoacyl-ACP synthase 3 [Wenzhouxiangellaceae bacterium]
MHARIIGTGRFLPEKVVTNADLEKIVETSDEWIQTRTGIRERRVAADDQTTCDLAEGASRAALEDAGVDPSEIDLVIVGTTTPDVVFPSTACLLQQRLGLGECGAFDVNAACSGFIYALSVATQYIEAGTCKRVLVVGAETLTRMVDWTDRTTCVLFGDGAGAAVLAADEEAGVMSTHIHANGGYGDLLKVDVGVSRGFR